MPQVEPLTTPLGRLADLDLSDHDVCASLLAEEKHQLIEGIVFESVFDQYVDAMHQASDGALRPVPVETVIATLPSPIQAARVFGAFVWAKQRTQGLGRLLAALEARYRVWLVEWHSEPRAFFATPVSRGHSAGDPQPLEEVCAAASGRNPTPVVVAPDVRDRYRINQSVWGYLSSHYGDGLGTKVVLPRIFINWGVQPWFGGVWNLDRVFLYGDQLWHMEIKHKYPMERAGTLRFGINDGELGQIANVLDCGLRSLHVVTVKPFWARQSGSMYLLHNFEARSRAAILAKELTLSEVSSALRGAPARAGAHTSLTGRAGVPFRSFKASTFRMAGALSDPPSQIAAAFVSQMRGGQLPPACTDGEIRALRITAPQERRGAIS